MKYSLDLFWGSKLGALSACQVPHPTECSGEIALSTTVPGVFHNVLRFSMTKVSGNPVWRPTIRSSSMPAHRSSINVQC